MLRNPQGRLILAWACAQIVLGTLVYMWLEGWSTVDALYFSVVTLATVGFGDLHPTTDAAKLFTVLYILFGLGIIAAFISELTKQRTALVARLHAHDPARGTHAGGTVTGPATAPPKTDDEGQI
jgi:hypothetical protein